MEQSDSPTASFRFSTRDLEPSDRLSMLREVIGKTVVRLDIEPQGLEPTHAELTASDSPGFRRTTLRSTMTARMHRPLHMISDGDDSVTLLVKTGGQISVSQRERQLVPETGNGVVILNGEPASITFSQIGYSAVIVPRSALTGVAADVEAAAARRVPRQMEALRLLQSYLSALPERISRPELSSLAALHIHDLVALAVGATRDGEAIAQARGVRAARLEAIKADLVRDPRLDLAALAARQQVTPRYIQMLFEHAGTTFSAFSLELRLKAAHAMLASPRYREWTITAIALEAGFEDISHFNRTFKRRFSQTPSEWRAACRSETPASGGQDAASLSRPTGPAPSA